MVIGRHRVGEAIVSVIGRQREDLPVLRPERALALGPAEVVPGLHLVDRLDLPLPYVAQIHRIVATGVPADPVRIAHPDGVDLTECIRLVDKRVVRGNAVLAVLAALSERVDPHDRALRGGQILRVAVSDAVPAVPDEDVQVAVVGIAGLHRGVEGDLLHRVHPTGEREAHQLPAGALEGLGRRIGGGPLGDHAVERRVAIGGKVRLVLSQRTAALGVHGVEDPVLGKLRMELHKPKTGAQPGMVVEVVHELLAHVQVRHVLAGLLVHQVEDLVHVRNHQAPGVVGDLVQVGDPVVSDQPLVLGLRCGLRLRELGQLGDLDTEGGQRRVGQRVQQWLLLIAGVGAVGRVPGRVGEVLSFGVDRDVVQGELTVAAGAVDPEEPVQGAGHTLPEVELFLSALGQAGDLLVGAALAVDGHLVGGVVGHDPHALPGVLRPVAHRGELVAIADQHGVVVLVVHVGTAVRVGRRLIDVGDTEGGVHGLSAQEPEEHSAGLTVCDLRDGTVRRVRPTDHLQHLVVPVQRVRDHLRVRCGRPPVLSVQALAGVVLEVEQLGEAVLLRCCWIVGGGRCGQGAYTQHRRHSCSRQRPHCWLHSLC